MKICIEHTPSWVYFCEKKRTQEGVWLLYIFFCNHKEVQVNLCKGIDIRQQTVPFKHDSLGNHRTLPELPSSQIAIYIYIYIFFLLKLPSHFLHYIYTVQITHNLNGTHVCKSKKHMWHQTTRVHTCARIYTRVKWMHHIHALIHTKYLPRNDPPYNQ